MFEVRPCPQVAVRTVVVHSALAILVQCVTPGHL